MICLSPFETEICGFPVYKLTISDDGKIDHHLKQVLKETQGHVITKVPGGQPAWMRFLGENGFLFSVSSLNLKSSTVVATQASLPQIRKISRDDLPALYSICDKSFSEGNRFANDFVLNAFTQKIHRTWLENSVNGYADYCIGVEVSSSLVGFATLHLQNSFSTVGLIAVAPEGRGEGVGTALMNGLKRYAHDHSCSEIRVTTECSNDRALNFYIRNGFRFFANETSLYRPLR